MTAPLILACDTTQGACSAALYQDGVLAAALAPMQKGHAEALMPMLEKLVDEAGVEMAAIDRLAVTHGPGSFTGVRVGLSAMRGLAVALHAPLKTYGTLELMARGAHAQMEVQTALLVAVDARRETFYAQSFAANGSAENLPQALDLKATLALHETRPLAAIGTGAPLLAAADSALDILPAPDWPDAAILAGWAAQDAAWDDLPPAEPLYLRPPDASLPDPAKKIARLEGENMDAEHRDAKN